MTLLFPQLVTGAVAQFPIAKEYLPATALNIQEDGTRYRYSDPDPIRMAWTLRYRHLTSTEVNLLETFFQTTLGPVIPFTFLDPSNNLLAWSEDLNNAIWQKSPLLNASGTTFSGAGSATQILSCPNSATLCLSVLARADQPAQLSLTLADTTSQFTVAAGWTQYFVTRTGSGGATTTDATVSSGGSSLQIAKVMVSAQPAPGGYMPTNDIAGVMTNTRFDQNSLAITAEGVNDFSCDIRLISNLE